MGSALAVIVSLVGAVPSSAAPNSVPTTSGDAKKLWEDGAHRAEVAAEQLNGARVVLDAATQAQSMAAAALGAASRRVATTADDAGTATAVAQDYQHQLNDFAAASFRGASLSPLSTMLSARSANDFLDQSTVVARIAQQSRRTMAAASAARASAAAAAAAAQTAQRSAAQAASAAAEARSTAASAADTAKIRKGQLDAAVVTAKELYGKLSAQERRAAAAAAARARAASAAAAKAALEQQRQAAAQLQAQQAERQRSLEQSADRQAQQQADAQPMTAAAAVTTSPAAPAPEITAPAIAGSMLPTVISPPAADASPPSTATSAAVAGARSTTGDGDNLGQIVAQAALTKVGGGYCYACDGPTSYDCSGLTTWAWAQAGISIPRVSYEQAKFPVVPMDQLQPGDLVTYYSPVSHVAIYVGNGMIVSAVDEQSGIMYRAVGRGGPNAVGHRVPRN